MKSLFAILVLTALLLVHPFTATATFEAEFCIMRHLVGVGFVRRLSDRTPSQLMAEKEMVSSFKLSVAACGTVPRRYWEGCVEALNRRDPKDSHEDRLDKELASLLCASMLKE